jgi:hypothetical protein
LGQYETPASLPNLDAALERGALRLEEFCKSVSDLLPSTSGQKGTLDSLLKGTIVDTLLKSMIAGLSALYNDHRQDDALTRRTIQTQLEAAKWPDFARVEAAK